MSLPEPRVSPRATSRVPDYKVLAGRRPRPSSNQIPQVIEACPVGRGIDFNNGPSRPLINPPLSLLNPTPRSQLGRGIDFTNLTVGVTVGVRLHY